MIGQTLTHFKITAKLGEGGMGEVFLAEDTKLRRQVALKVLPEELTRDEERKQRFLQEARAAAAIEHPHIAVIYEIAEADGRTFIAMEHVGGESLRSAIAARRLDQRKSLDLAIQIAEGLSVAHQRGIVHRDLKPENLLVSEHGYAKIIDFGLAKLTEPLAGGGDGGIDTEAETRLQTREGVVMGTVAYMSPEQARGVPVDARSDVFSFGVVLYEMLSGVSPFLRDTAVESLHAVMKETVAPLESSGGTPTELQRIVRKAMAKDPEERYQSMKDLVIDLRGLREGLSSSVEVDVAVDTSSPTRLRWVWASVLVVIVLVALAFAWSSGRQDAKPAGIGASGRPAVAVMYFENYSGDEEIRWLTKGLPSMLLTNLAQTPGLDVVSSQRIHEILKQVGKEGVETIEKGMVAEIARRSGAGAVVVGGIFKSGSDIRIDVQVEDVETGRVLFADSVTGGDVFPMIDELTASIRNSLRLTDMTDARALSEMTTSSLEAYQLYTLAVEAILNVRQVEARELLMEAVRIDPSFVLANFELSVLVLGWRELELSDQYRQKVVADLGRLPDRQRLFIEATYARHDRDFERATELLEALVDQFPDERRAYSLLAGLYRGSDDSEKSFEIFDRAVRALPRSGSLRNMYGYELMRVGRFEDALREFEAYEKFAPREPNPYDSQGEVYIRTGRPEKAIEMAARALEVDPEFEWVHDLETWGHAMLGRYDESIAAGEKLDEFHERIDYPNTGSHFWKALRLSRVGRYRDAEGEIELGKRVAESGGNVRYQVELHLLSAWLAIELEDYPRVATETQRAHSILPEVPLVLQRDNREVLARLLAGVAQARAGSLEAAQEELDQAGLARNRLETGQAALASGWYQALAGEIAFAKSDVPAAETAWIEAEPEEWAFFNRPWPMVSAFANNLTFRDGLARSQEARGDLAAAIETYRVFLDPRNEKWTSWLEPRYVLRLARLLDETGDKDEAREEYERFLDLWKNADEGLPELAEARAYVRK